MILQQRINWLSKLGNYMLSNELAWEKAKHKASMQNGWFVPEFVALAIKNIAENFINFSEMLKNCDAYIATGSNNTYRYFEYYFGKYPHIIRRNKTSVAVLTGLETDNELEELADDVYQFFGLGCRNVTKIYIPAGYNFESLLTSFKKYNYLADHH